MTITLLRARKNQLLAKVWRADGAIEPAAHTAWFEAAEILVESVEEFLAVISGTECKPRIALVKEAIAPGADPNRLRRRCDAGVDKRTGEAYPPGLRVVERRWVPLDVEKLSRPPPLDWRDGDALAEYVRSQLPGTFKSAACLWQFSGSSGHPSRRDEIRLHLFFMCDEPVLPEAWKRYFAGVPFVDQSAFDKAKLIFTAAPVIHNSKDPISQRHGLLNGEAAVRVPVEIAARSAKIARGDGDGRRVVRSMACAPMPDAAAEFIEIVARSKILRSHSPAYRNERGRRLAFCTMLKMGFGIEDEAALEAAFYKVCVGGDDPHSEHDAQQALAWADNASPSGRNFSTRKLLCDAAAALYEAGDTKTAGRGSRLAMVFFEIEARAARTKEHSR